MSEEFQDALTDELKAVAILFRSHPPLCHHMQYNAACADTSARIDPEDLLRVDPNTIYQRQTTRIHRIESHKIQVVSGTCISPLVYLK